MKLISKLIYQANKKGLDIEKNDGVLLKNPITGKHIRILPNGKVCSDDILGHDHALKELMPEEFLIKDPFSGSSICIPCNVMLHVGKNTSFEDITFAKHCLSQCFANIKNFHEITDCNLLSHECMIKHEYALSFKERQALIKACLEYLK